MAGVAGLATATRDLPASAARASAARSTAVADPASGSRVPGPDHDFVTNRDARFYADGKPWRFGGTNTYYLHRPRVFGISSGVCPADHHFPSALRPGARHDYEQRPG